MAPNDRLAEIESPVSSLYQGGLHLSAFQTRKHIESIVLPLEFLQQFKVSDFLDAEEYKAWKVRNLKVLEEGVLLHPVAPLEKNDPAMARLRQILKGASERPLETGKNSDSMQALRSAVMALASRSLDGYPLDICHWADGLPLNLILYQKLLEACFDGSDESALIEELDEVLEILKKTWLILGLNEMLHNLCFSWVLFHRFVTTGQVENELLFASENQLAEVGNVVKATKDPSYAKILNSTLSSMLGWAEKRLLAYHDTFQAETIDSMQSIASLGVSAAKMLVEDISSEYRRKRGQEVDVARNRFMKIILRIEVIKLHVFMRLKLAFMITRKMKCIDLDAILQNIPQIEIMRISGNIGKEILGYEGTHANFD